MENGTDELDNASNASTIHQSLLERFEKQLKEADEDRREKNEMIQMLLKKLLKDEEDNEDKISPIKAHSNRFQIDSSLVKVALTQAHKDVASYSKLTDQLSCVDNFDEFTRLVMRYGQMLKLKGFLDLSIVGFDKNGDTPDFLLFPDDLIHDNDELAISAIESVSVTGSSTANSKVAKIVHLNDDEVISLQSSIMNLSAALTSAVDKSAYARGILNIDDAATHGRGILMWRNLCNTFAAASGVSIIALIRQLVLIRQSKKNRSSIFSPVELLQEVDRLSQELAKRSCPISDIILVTCLVMGMNHDQDLQTKLLGEITDKLVKNQPVTFNESAKYIRTHGIHTIRQSKPTTTGTKTTNRSNIEGDVVYNITGNNSILPGEIFDPSTDCGNCFVHGHTNKMCLNACRRCTFDKVAAGGNNRSPNVPHKDCSCRTGPSRDVKKKQSVNQVSNKVVSTTTLNVNGIFGDSESDVEEGKLLCQLPLPIINTKTYPSITQTNTDAAAEELSRSEEICYSSSNSNNDFCNSNVILINSSINNINSLSIPHTDICGIKIPLTHPDIDACIDSGSSINATGRTLDAIISTNTNHSVSDANDNVTLANTTGYLKEFPDFPMLQVGSFGDKVFLGASPICDKDNILILDSKGCCFLQSTQQNKEILAKLIRDNRVILSARRNSKNLYTTSAPNFRKVSRKIYFKNLQRQSTKNKEYEKSIRNWHNRYHHYRDRHPNENITQESYALIEPKPTLTKFQRSKQVAHPITDIPNVLLIEDSTVNDIEEDIDCSSASCFDTTLSPDDKQIDFVQVIATYQSKQFSTNRELVHFWHEALGHPNMEQMITIADQHTLKNWCKKLTPKVIRKFFPKNCASCIAGNLATSPSPSTSSSNESTTDIGHSIQIDLFCPLDQDGKNPLKSRTGHKYALLAVDTASRFTISKTFKSRKNLLSHLQDIVKQYKQRYKNIHQIDFHGIKNIKFDNEFKQDEIISYLKDEGIFYQFAAPHEHDTIGIVERYNRTLQEMLTKTLHSSKCDSTLWPLILRDCVFKHNLRPRNGTSPYEQWFGHKFDIQKYPILPFGAQVMAHVPIKMQRKLKYKAIPTIVVGTNTYTPGGVLLYCPSTNRVITRRTFRLTSINSTYDKLFEATDQDSTDLDLLDILNNDLFPSQFTGVEPEPSIPNSSGNSANDTDLLSSVANNVPSSLPAIASAVPNESSIQDQSKFDNSSTTINLTPEVQSTTNSSNPPQARYSSGRTKRIILRSPKTHTIRYYDKDNFVNSIQNHTKTNKRYVSLPIPKTVDEVNRTPQALEWLQAIRTELKSIKERGCFIDIDETKLIPKDRIIESKLVFDIRYNPDGSIKKFKCRLVARGDKQPWQTYDQTYADTMTSKSVNILLSIIADQDLEMSKIAF